MPEKTNNLTPRDQRDGTAKRRSRLRPSARSYWGLLLLALLALFLLQHWFGEERSEIDYRFFHEQLQARNIRALDIRGQEAYGEFREAPLAPSSAEPQPAADQSHDKPGATSADRPAGPVLLNKKFVVTLLSEQPSAELQKELLDAGVNPLSASKQTDYTNLFALVWLALLVIVLFAGWNMARQTRDQVLGGGMLSGVLRSPARRYAEEGPGITFNDVAGLGNVKKDLQEIVQFLKEPEKFQRLGARVPKGVLLMGPPGTGKTLLAKAVAGEAKVPFFSINGSEFIQLFVGVGAGRVRDMFKTAQANAPSILFIDEIDAVGRQRGAGLGGGHDEREQTLNQILSEMDGFSPATTVIVIAATNRPDVLDPALLRPGRFDRHITVDRPTIAGRLELFELHSRGVPIADDVDFKRLARGTVGLTGADIRNLVNEAALWATRQDKKSVTASDFEYARDKELMGATREDILTEKEKLLTAYHEAGHALLAWLIPGCDRVHKVTIIPRGRALGVTHLVADEDRHNVSQSDLEAQLAMALGGRAAEELQFDELTAGAESDLQRATHIARRMVTHWGMSERIGPVAYNTTEDHPFLGREMTQHERQFSEHTAQVIDEEVAKILHAAEDRAKRTLEQHSAQLGELAEALLAREVLDESEIAALIGPSVQQRNDLETVADVAQVASIGNP
ncbi:MAG TPA: ATP-dependent zinc metalloprotease FtsH [Lacipirellulaceae bacterium]|jgi:cell division protease FtsH